MIRLRTIGSSLLSLILLFSTAQAQSVIAKGEKSAGVTITASASGEHMRFAAPSSVVQIRLEVYDSTGRKLFDNEVRGGNALDWHLQDGQAEPLADGAYLCVVTVKSLSGKLTQKIGSVSVEKSTAIMQAAAASRMTQQQTEAIGPVEANALLTMLEPDQQPTTTVMAHDGEDGLITRGRGALSFRMGDFYSGTDREQMRLTAEGNFGIGIAHPQARKALLLVNQDGTINVCYNSQLAGATATTSPCGYSVTHQMSSGVYDITFPFQVNTRFFSATVADTTGQGIQDGAAVRPFSQQGVRVITSSPGSAVDAAFYLVVF